MDEELYADYCQIKRRCEQYRLRTIKAENEVLQLRELNKRFLVEIQRLGMENRDMKTGIDIMVNELAE